MRVRLARLASVSMFIVSISLAFVLTTGCNAVKGAGKDISDTAENVDRAVFGEDENDR